MVLRTFNHYSTIRTGMIADTTRFLDWALANVKSFPRIPRVRVDSGIHFSERIKVAFWSAALLKMSGLQPPHEQQPPAKPS